MVKSDFISQVQEATDRNQDYILGTILKATVQSLPDLQELAKSRESKGVFRTAAIKRLSEIMGIASVSFLEQLIDPNLENDADVRGAAYTRSVALLIKFGRDPSSLKARAKNDPDRWVRILAK